MQITVLRHEILSLSQLHLNHLDQCLPSINENATGDNVVLMSILRECSFA